ncbi:hypothetical protein HIM_00919 [Hirsutella minnesotensis 3608]|nr:hypothetical protein HIM_00919 [Hirsutella minnesotensis 3608]
MKVSVTTILLAAAIGASAHPSGHAHHMHLHRAVGQSTKFYKNTRPDVNNVYEKPNQKVDDAPAPPPSSPPPPPAPPVVVPPPQPTYAKPQAPVEPKEPAEPAEPSEPAGPSGNDNGKGISTYQPFCGGKTKRATLQEIAEPGKLGVVGNYGCNVMLIQSGLRDRYPYTMTFDNKGNKQQECACWLKIGKDGGINGFFAGNEVFKFPLSPGKQQVVAVDSNSKGGCSCSAGSLQKTSFGQWAGTWAEFDFSSATNSKADATWSGADASCLVAADNKMTIPGMRVSQLNNPSSKPSTICPGGTGTNAYTPGTHALDGVGLNIKGDKVPLLVEVDYQC